MIKLQKKLHLASLMSVNSLYPTSLIAWSTNIWLQLGLSLYQLGLLISLSDVTLLVVKLLKQLYLASLMSNIHRMFWFLLQDGKPTDEQCQASNSADSWTAREPKVWLLLFLKGKRILVGEWCLWVFSWNCKTSFILTLWYEDFLLSSVVSTMLKPYILLLYLS